MPAHFLAETWSFKGAIAHSADLIVHSEQKLALVRGPRLLSLETACTQSVYRYSRPLA